MKKLLLPLILHFSFFIFHSSFLNAQSIPPPFINYQAVLYDVNNPTPNAVFSNQSFPTFVNISDELGNLLYREEHYASTDGNGLITVKMGDGLYVAGPITNFNQIDWGTGKYYLVVDFNINGTISSTAPEQLVTVPYSFYSGKAGNGMTSVSDNGNGTLTFTYANGSTYTTPTLSGIQGPTGATGPVGPTGAAGPAGQSAYELWLAQGNTGTVQDYLSGSAYQIWLAQGNTGTSQDFLNTLVGPSGASGIQGPVGPTGPQGIQGPIGPAGSQGSQGIQGAQGPAGANGLNALIKTTTEPSGANCANGGTKIETGLDANGNGELEAGEVLPSQTQYLCNTASSTSIGSTINHFVPDGFGNASIVNHTLVPQCCTMQACTTSITPYTVPAGKNLYISNINFSHYAGCGVPGVYANSVRIAAGACGGNYTQPFIVGEGMVVTVNMGNNSGCGYGCACGNGSFSGFLVDKNYEVILQNTPYVVPANKTFVKVGTSVFPAIYPSGQTVPASTNGYIIPN